MGDIPENSDVAAEAAGKLGPAKALAVISINIETGTFEARVFGANARFRVLAGRMADICLEALDSTTPDSATGFNWSMMTAELLDGESSVIDTGETSHGER